MENQILQYRKNISLQTESIPFLGQLILNVYNESYNLYNITEKINTIDNTPFLRFWCET